MYIFLFKNMNRSKERKIVANTGKLIEILSWKNKTKDWKVKI